MVQTFRWIELGLVFVILSLFAACTVSDYKSPIFSAVIEFDESSRSKIVSAITEAAVGDGVDVSVRSRRIARDGLPIHEISFEKKGQFSGYAQNLVKANELTLAVYSDGPMERWPGFVDALLKVMKEQGRIVKTTQ